MSLHPLPPHATQQTLVAASRELITRFERKTQATVARIWGEGEPGPAEE